MSDQSQRSMASNLNWISFMSMLMALALMTQCSHQSRIADALEKIEKEKR